MTRHTQTVYTQTGEDFGYGDATTDPFLKEDVQKLALAVKNMDNSVGRGNAVTRVHDKGSQVYNVVAYGALGDGSTDDLTAFQTACAAAAAAGGGTVYVPQSSTYYKLSAGLGPYTNVALVGAGRLASVVKWTGNTDGWIPGVGSTVRSLTLRGNTTTTSGAHGVDGGGSNDAVVEDCIIELWGAIGVNWGDSSVRTLVRNCVIRSCKNEGVYLGQNSNDGIVTGNEIYSCLKNGVDCVGNRNRIVHNVIYTIGAALDTSDTNGILVGNSSGNTASDNLVQGNVIHDCQASGIYLWGGGTVQHTLVQSNHCYSNVGRGIFVEAAAAGVASHNQVIGNNCRSNTDHGILIDGGSNNLVADNRVVSNGGRGILITNTAATPAQTQVLGNAVISNTSYGINIAAGTDAVVSGNMVLGNTAGQIQNAATRTVLYGNKTTTSDGYAHASSLQLDDDLLMGSTGGAAGTNIRTRVIASLANNGTAQFPWATGSTGLVAIVLIATSSGDCAIFAIDGGNNATHEISDPNSKFSGTAGTGSSTNIYYSSGNTRYEIENKYGGTQTYSLFFFSAG